MGLIEALQNQGIDVYAIAPRDDYSKLLEQAGCQFEPVKMDSRGTNPMKDIRLIKELYNVYKKIRPDVVLHYTIKPNIYGTVAASLLRIPVVNNVCGLGTVFLKEGITSRIAIGMYKMAFRFPRKVFFQNDYDLDLFVERRIVKKGICDVLPGSGIDLNRFSPMGSSRTKGKFTFLLISRLLHDKGVLEYIDAVRKLKESGLEAHFQILGPKAPDHKRGIDLSIIDSWLEQGLVEYLGTTDDVREYIDKADCVVLPSYREGTPRTLLEAASSAKPIVTTDVPGCNNVVSDNENGFLCRLKDADDLAQKMKKMAELPDDKLLEMGRVGRKRMEERFSEHVVINKYLHTLNQIK